MNDEKFTSLLGSNDDEGPTIGSIEEFTEWKQEFLDELKDFLDPTHTAVAREADEELYVRLEGLARGCLTVKTLCKEGKITADSTSVKGQKTINELCTALKDCESSIEEYVPKTKRSEKKAGYTKFDLAAVAIRDGFRVYGLMCATRDYLVGLVDEHGPLAGVLRDNQLATCMYYFRCLEAFCECMQDLGIYKVMEDCVEAYKVRPRGKKKKHKKNFSSGDTALDLSSDEERALEKIRKKKKALAGTAGGDDDGDDDGIINNGQMFSNRNLGGKKTRAIMTKGWSNGLAPGEEVKGPDGVGGAKKKKKKKTKAKKGDKPGTGASGGGAKSRRGGNASSDDDDDDLDSRATGNGSEDGSSSDENSNSNDPANPKSKKTKTSSKGSKGKNGDGEEDDDDGDDNSTTQPTDDEEGSSSEEDSDDDDSGSDDEDYIYYFDPVQKVVGKIPRSACEKEGLIVTVDKSTGNEAFDGKVDHWDTKQAGGDDEDQEQQQQPGLTDLIGSMREVLRPPKQ